MAFDPVDSSGVIRVCINRMLSINKVDIFLIIMKLKMSYMPFLTFN
jgi:hypothetical protein